MKLGILKDLRVLLLILAILGSLIAISPRYENGTLNTNLKLGLILLVDQRYN